MYICVYVCVCVDSIYVFVCCQVVDCPTTFRIERLIVHHVVTIWGPRNLAMFSVLSVRSVFIIMSRVSSRSVEPPPYFKWTLSCSWTSVIHFDLTSRATLRDYFLPFGLGHSCLFGFFLLGRDLVNLFRQRVHRRVRAMFCCCAEPPAAEVVGEVTPGMDGLWLWFEHDNTYRLARAFWTYMYHILSYCIVT